MENQKIFDKLSNFNLNPQDVNLSVVNRAIVSIPTELLDNLWTIANTHFRVAQYAMYDAYVNPNPQLGFWDSVYLKQLELIEDYEPEDCDCDDPIQAGGNAFLAGLLMVAAGYAGGIAGANANYLQWGAAVKLLEARDYYIRVDGSAVKTAFALQPRAEMILDGISYVKYMDIPDWNARPAGELRLDTFYWKFTGTGGAGRNLNLLGCGNEFGQSYGFQLLPAGDQPPGYATVITV